jgi:hypothetical protein
VFTVEVVASGPIAAITDLVSPFAPRAPVRRPLMHYRVDEVGTGRFSLTVDDFALVPDSNPWHVLAMLQWHINQAVVADGVATRLLLHAAGATRDGVTVVLAAPMENGKTTTVTGLVRSGFGYLTDETVAIDPETLMVTAYPKALTLDQGSWTLFPELRVPAVGPSDSSWFVTSDRVRPGAQVDAADAPGLLVFPAYRAGAVTEAVPLTASEAVLELAKSTFQFEASPSRNLTALARVARRAAAYRLEIGALDEAVQVIHALVDEAVAR